jgi:hypothetical protein
MNTQCNNYKQELNEGTDICSLCNEQVTKIDTKINPKLFKWALILSLAGFTINAGGGWILGAFIPGGVMFMDIAGSVAMAAAVIVGIISRSKSATALSTILLPIGVIVMLASYGAIEIF